MHTPSGTCRGASCSCRRLLWLGVAYGGVWGWCRGRHRAAEQCRHLEACRRAGAGGAVGDGGVACCVVARARAKASRAGPEVAVVAGARRLVERTRALEVALPEAQSREWSEGERAARGASPWSRGSALPCKAGPGGRRRHVTSAVGWRKASLREADRSFAVAAMGWRRHVVGGARGGAAGGAAGVMSFLRCARLFRRRRGVGVGVLLCGWGGAVGATAASMWRALPREAGRSVAAVATGASVGTEAAPWVALPLGLCRGSRRARPRSRLPSPSWAGRRRVDGGGGFAGCVAVGVAGGPSGLRWRRCRRRWVCVVGGLMAGRRRFVGGWRRRRDVAVVGSCQLLVTRAGGCRRRHGRGGVGGFAGGATASSLRVPPGEAMRLSPPREGTSWVWVEAVPWALPHRFVGLAA